MSVLHRIPYGGLRGVCLDRTGDLAIQCDGCGRVDTRESLNVGDQDSILHASSIRCYTGDNFAWRLCPACAIQAGVDLDTEGITK